VLLGICAATKKVQRVLLQYKPCLGSGWSSTNNIGVGKVVDEVFQ